jgi:hypothetical protein
MRSSSTSGSRLRPVAAACALCVIAAASPADGRAQDDKERKEIKKASLSLKASPTIVFSPARVVVTAELKGGADDSDELYCPSLEWDWGDGTRSEANADCEPFEAGKSTIQRRFTQAHTFNIAGNYRVQLRLKRGSKIVLGGHISVQVKPGLRDPSENF